MGGVLDEDGDGDTCTRAGSEDFPALASATLTRCSLVALQVVDEDPGELFLQRQAHAVRRVAVHEGAVGDEGDDATLPDAVRVPPKRAEIGVVEAVLVFSG